MSKRKTVRTDIRLVWLAIFLIICYFQVNPLPLPIKITKETQATFQVMEDLPPGGVVMLIGSYVSTNPDSYYGALAMINYITTRDLRLVLWYLLPQTPLVGEQAVAETRLYDKMDYGVDVVNLGYVPGGASAVRDMCADVWNAVGGKDYYGTPLNELPMMEDIKDIHDVAMVINIFSASPGIDELLTQMQAPYNKPFIAMCTATGYPSRLPFFRSGELVGITKGARGAAELEVLTKIPGPATGLMSAQSAGHLLLIIFIILANLRPYLSFLKLEGGK